jgi:hypothetical protein
MLLVKDARHGSPKRARAASIALDMLKWRKIMAYAWLIALRIISPTHI